MRQFLTPTLLACVSGLAISLICQETAAQSTKKDAQPGLAFRIILTKDTYALNEEVVAKYEFANRSDQTLCLPPPVLKCANTRSGAVLTTARSSARAGQDRDIFICDYDGGDWGPSAKLLSQIEKHWIKIAPNKSYVTETAKINPRLDMLGEWQLEARYSPPQAAFGDPAHFRKYLNDGANRAGCVIPEPAQSVPVAVSVVPLK